jgi:hypothetical protein
MLSFFRLRRGRGPADLAIGMTGVRLGERLLQAGPGDPAVFAALAGKVGLTGRACAAVAVPRDGEALEAAAVHEGVLIEVAVAPPGSWPFEDDGFDLAIVDGNMLMRTPAEGQDAWLAAVLRAVRGGGRVLAVERTPRTLLQRLGFESSLPSSPADHPLVAMLTRAGFGPVRLLAAREGLTFVEAFRPRQPSPSVV